MNIKVLSQKLFSCGIYFLIFLIILFMFGCGASRQGVDLNEKDINLEELLGEEETSPKDKESEEAEVLRLLGITPAEEESQKSEISFVQQEPEKSSLQTEVSQLEKELAEKDKEISNLRSELTKKEAKISDLESNLLVTERSRITPPRMGLVQNPTEDFKSRYQFALSQFNARNYQEARSLFNDLLSTDPNNSLSDNCQYWIGECYYALGNYNQAIAEFEKVFSFPNSNKSDDSQLKLGICYLKLGDRQQARAEFERLLSNYPESEYISLAQRYLNRL